jgi:thiamine pyrophosphate-dependent acetolactate synthase large subunit-like protein
MESCDTLLMLGTDCSYRQFYPQTARIAQIDTRAESIGGIWPAAVGAARFLALTGWRSGEALALRW